MSELSEILAARIDQRLQELGGKPEGKTRYWLGKTATEGRRVGLVTDIASKGYVPKEPTLRQVAIVLGVSVDWLMGRTNDPDPVRSEASIAGYDSPPAPVGMLGERRNEFRGPSASPGVPLVGTGDCAELDATDPSGHHVRVERSSFDPDFPIRFLERPPALLGSRNAYAIYFHGTSMEHRFYAGEIGYVDPDRHASPSDFVVVQLTNGAGDEVVSVLVKRLVRQTPNYVELEQFNPPLIFRIERRLVARMHRILPPSELFNR